MHASTGQTNRYLGYFFLLVFVLSVPFWLVGGAKLPIPVNLPFSALMLFCPLLAALILSYRQDGLRGIKNLLTKAFDFRKIENKIWYVPILLLVPFLYFLSYAITRLAGMPLPEPEIPLLMVFVFFVIYFVAATIEELGWMGYAIDPMQERWGALKASLLLGLVWEIWHIIPHMQQSHSATWILWQSLYSVALRILIVWIYNNAGQSVFAASLVHTVDSVSWSLFPNYGSHYDPFVMCIVTWLVVVIVLFGWGRVGLYKHARASRL